MLNRKDYVELIWNGKEQAIKESELPTNKKLITCEEESKDFDTTQNLYIEGDNLDALKLLKKEYQNKIKMIYIDPPYNTGNKFIYSDNLSHADWLNMIYPRLKLARDLLTDDGVIFISIDDNEQANLKKVCDEIFGEGNFVAQINWKGRGGKQDSKYYAVLHEYIFVYCKNIQCFVAGEEIKSGDNFPYYDEEMESFYKTQLLRKWGSNSRREDRPNLFYSIKSPDGTDVYPMINPNEQGCWRWGKDTMQKALNEHRVLFVKKDERWIAYEKIFAPKAGNEQTKKYITCIDDISNGTSEIKNLFNKIVFDYSKASNLVEKFINMANTTDSSLVLDFFSGSATTAHAVMKLNAEDGGNRKFIMVQLPEVCAETSEAYKAGFKNICEIGKERIRRAGQKIKDESPLTTQNLDVGFRVLKIVDKD